MRFAVLLLVIGILPAAADTTLDLAREIVRYRRRYHEILIFARGNKLGIAGRLFPVLPPDRYLDRDGHG